MKKISILALHLGTGGIERIVSMLANNLVGDYEVEIASVYKIYDEPFFKLNDKVHVKYLLPELKPNKKEFLDSLKHFRLLKTIKEGFKSIKTLRLKKSRVIDYLKECDADYIISTRDIHNALLGKYGSKKAIKIGWEHNHHNNDKKYIKKIIKSVSNLDSFVLVSNELKEFYQDKVKPECIFIPNCIDYYPDKRSNLDCKNIISVGRLSPEKNPVELVEVFNLVSKKYPDWHLDIFGDGVLYQKVKDKIDEYKLNDKVKLHGFKSRDIINDYLSTSSIFLTTSKTESFGIVVLEAFAFGIPCVAYKSARGICEIAKNNYDAYLIDNRDRELMVKKICDLINQPAKLKIMGDYAYKTSLKYNEDNFKKMWLDLLNK